MAANAHHDTSPFKGSIHNINSMVKSGALICQNHSVMEFISCCLTELNLEVIMLPPDDLSLICCLTGLITSYR
jgi:hypothetical protein